MSYPVINTKSVSRIAAVQTLYHANYDSKFSQKNHEENISDNQTYNKFAESSLSMIIELHKNEDVHDIYDDCISHKDRPLKIKLNQSHLKKLVHLTYENTLIIHQIIEKHLVEKWTIDNLPKLLYIILSVAICEIKFLPSTPYKVAIDEYTNIANNMLDPNAVGFVNSLLDRYVKDNIT